MMEDLFPDVCTGVLVGVVGTAIGLALYAFVFWELPPDIMLGFRGGAAIGAVYGLYLWGKR